VEGFKEQVAGGGVREGSTWHVRDRGEVWRRGQYRSTHRARVIDRQQHRPKSLARLPSSHDARCDLLP